MTPLEIYDLQQKIVDSIDVSGHGVNAMLTAKAGSLLEGLWKSSSVPNANLHFIEELKKEIIKATKVEEKPAK